MDIVRSPYDQETPVQHHPRGRRDQMLDLYGLPASPPESQTPRPAPAGLSSHRCDGVCSDGERRRMPKPNPVFTWVLGAAAAALFGTVAVLGFLVGDEDSGGCAVADSDAAASCAADDDPGAER